MSSPDGSLSAELSINPGGELRYCLKSHGNIILEPSPLGITVDGVDLGKSAIQIESKAPSVTLRSYPKIGSSTNATDHHNRFKLSVDRIGEGDRNLTIEARIFDDAFAFRYFIPGNTIRDVDGEQTGWNLPAGSNIWFQEDALTNCGDYKKAVIGSLSATAGGPITVGLPGDHGFLLVSEASLFEYSGMSFAIEGNGNTGIRSVFPHELSWKKAGGFATPWRVTLHAETLDELVNSDLFGNLCPQPKALSLQGGAKSPWILPGRMLGSKNINAATPNTFDSYISMIEQAHQLGFEYILIGEGWETTLPSGEHDAWERLATLCEFGRGGGRNVGVWITKSWADIMDQQPRGDFFFRAKVWGAVGVKLTGADSETYENLEIYREAMIEAGVFQLMIHMDGGGKSTGEHRTFPHELTRGGVRGLQKTYNGLQPVKPSHNAILPFTRFVPGPADCQPVTFDETMLGASTIAHQLATAGLFTSPLAHWADHPARYFEQQNALDIIHELPTTWDETKVLDISEIGKIAAMARRKGDRWFLFIINGDELMGKSFPQLPLSFLDERTYDSIQLGDLTQVSFNRNEQTAITNTASLSVDLLPGGGFVALFDPRPDLSDLTSDTDSDGIPDTLDSAPDDPTFSSPHTFYTDVDRDHFGDRKKPIRVNSKAPQPPLVAWGNDPNDYTMESYPEIAPKGTRMLGIESLQTSSNNTWSAVPLHELGAEVAPVRIDWGKYETSNGSFDGPDATKLKALVETFGKSGIRLALSVSAYDQGLPCYPEDLQTKIEMGFLSPNSAEIINRFVQWLGVLHQEIGNTALHSLQIGEALHITQSGNPVQHFWEDYLLLFQAAKLHAESLWGNDLIVLAATSHNSLISEETGQIFQDFMTAGDVVGIVFNPRLSSFDIIEPENLKYELESVLTYYQGRKFHLVDVSYPSSPGLFSSETKQSQSLRALFELWDEHAEDIPYMGITQLFDPPTDADLSKRDRYYGSLGLRSHDDTAKAAYKTLRNLTFERGWWCIPAAKTRSFLMGFSQTQYDLSDTIEERQEVLDWLLPKFAENSDISSIQIDMGVPWVEAFQDNLTTEHPPYHQQVLHEWSSLKSSVATGQPLVIAISPIGNPRSHISAYWGEAEGYHFVKGGFSGPEFVRVPNGTIKADSLRYPPPPWDTLPFNSPQVKEAYLKYCIRVIEYFKPDYLLTALEASACLIEDRERYDELVELMGFVYQSLKSYPKYAGIPQVISISTTSFIKDEYGIPYKFDEQIDDVFEEQIEGLSRLMPYMDMIGLSNYPHFGKYNGYAINASMYDSLFENIARAGGTGKPVVISENGYSADSYQILERPFPCTPEKQDAYLKNLIYSLNKSEHPVEYVINWAIRDNDRLWQRNYDAAISSNDETAILFSKFNQFFRDIGLYDGEGNANRPALARWKETLEAPVVPKQLLTDHPSYISWLLRHFPEVKRFKDLNPDRPWSPFHDFDGDQRTNIFEFLCDTDPHAFDSGNPLLLEKSGDQRWIELRINTRANDIRAVVQAATDLGSNWADLNGAFEIVNGPDENGVAVVRIPVPEGYIDKGFFRMKAELLNR